MKILILGLSITSSWGNGHATTYRSLCKALHARGHTITFVEKDVRWYRENRDLPDPSFCTVRLYQRWVDVQPAILDEARHADLIIIGSYFADAIAAADLLFSKGCSPVLFYDIDTPVTLAHLRLAGKTEYLRADQVGQYNAYLSFSGGPLLHNLREVFGAQAAYPLYCSVDPDKYRPSPPTPHYSSDLSYLGTYAVDRQQKLLELLNAPSVILTEQQFLVAGPQYPPTCWNRNVRQIHHVSPIDHPAFYSSSRFTLNLTRSDMVEAGYSPSVRLFEAAACGAAIVSDRWDGIDSFLEPGSEVLLVDSANDVVRILSDLSDEDRIRIGSRARDRILALHSADQRALELETIMDAVSASRVWISQ